MSRLWQDLRYALRMLSKSPRFTAIAALTLALGIGANAAIFSIVDAVLLRPLPYRDSSQIVFLSGSALDTGNFAEWRLQSNSFEQLAAVSLGQADLHNLAEAVSLRTAQVSADFFPLLGIRTALGRGFVSGDFQPGGARVAIVSYEFWSRWLDASPQSVGRVLALNTTSYTVIGVMPQQPGPLPYHNIDVWLPLLPSRAQYTSALGRLRPGNSLKTARVEAEIIAERFANDSAKRSGEPLIRVQRLKDQVVSDSRLTLLLLSGAVGFVLLIACANVANLLLTQLVRREREIAIRRALGAGRSRVVRQLVVEGLLLSGIGAGLGLVSAGWLVNVLVVDIPYYVPRIGQSKVDGIVVFFVLVMTIVSALVFTLAPALASSKPDLNDALKEGTRGSTGSAGQSRTRRALIVTQVALAMVMLTSAGLLIRTLLALQPSSPGFDPDQRLTVRSAVPYSAAGQQAAFVRAAIDRIRNLPTVQGVAAVSNLPMDGAPFVPEISIAGQVVAGVGRSLEVHYGICTPNYFRVMGMQIVNGRDFSSADDERVQNVTIINQTMARSFWPRESPIGQQLTVDWPDRPVEFTVVGVVHDWRVFGNSSSTPPEMYVPFWQDPQRRMSFVIHTSNDSAGIVSVVRDDLHSIDGSVVVSDVRTMNQILYDSVAPQRFNARIFGLLGGLALVLAMVGIYGVVSCDVTQRTHEIGVRIAMGAQQGDVLRMVMRDGLLPVGIGIVVGIAIALALTRFLRSILYGVSATDLLAFAGVSILFIAVAMAACYVPARRAMRVDPVIALRYE